MILSQKENSLLTQICQENQIDPEYITTLLAIEKDFANRNLMRRKGIKVQMQEHLNKWVKEI